MKCSCCGAALEPDSRFCGTCGARVPDAAPVEEPECEAPVQPVEEPVCEVPVQSAEECVDALPLPGGMLSEQDFYHRYMPQKGKYLVTALMVLCFITASLSFILLLLGSVIELLDVAVYLTAGYQLLKQKNWWIALGVTVYSGILTVLTLIIGGGLMGIPALVVGIFATLELRKHHQHYATYRNSGMTDETL